MIVRYASHSRKNDLKSGMKQNRGKTMFVMNSRGTEIINSEFVERFVICEKEDAALIVSSYSDTRRPVTMARYINLEEAQAVLGELLNALAGGQAYYTMPPSRLYAKERTIRDARVKRKGSS